MHGTGPLEEEVSLWMLMTPTLRNSGRSDLKKVNHLQVWDTMASEMTYTFPCISGRPHVKLGGDQASQQLRLLRMDLPLSLVVSSPSLEVFKKRPVDLMEGIVWKGYPAWRKGQIRWSLRGILLPRYKVSSYGLFSEFLVRLGKKGVKTENPPAYVWGLVWETMLDWKNMSLVLRDKGKSTSCWKDLWVRSQPALIPVSTGISLVSVVLGSSHFLCICQVMALSGSKLRICDSIV